MYANDLHFEIITDQIWRVPRKNLFVKCLNIFKHYYDHPKPSVPVRIGIKIINNTDKPLRFNFSKFLIPELTNSSNQVPVEGFCIRLEGGSAKEFPLLGTGETTSFMLDSVIFWDWSDKFGLHVIANDGFFWFFATTQIWFV